MRVGRVRTTPLFVPTLGILALALIVLLALMPFEPPDPLRQERLQGAASAASSSRDLSDQPRPGVVQNVQEVTSQPNRRAP